MNKEEILAKSRKENQHGDEMHKNIEKVSNQNAFLAIEAINALLVVVLVLQKLFTGKAFADYQVFMLSFFVGFIGSYTTKYYYTKKRWYMFGIVCAILGTIFCLINIIGKGMGWF